MFGKGKKTKKTINLQEVLQSSVKNKGSGGILSRLFRKILQETNIVYTIERLIRDYEKNSDKEKSQIQTQVLAEELTWKSFTDLIINLLKVRSFTFTIKLTHNVKDAQGNWKVTSHEVSVTPYNNISHIETKEEEKEIKDGGSTNNSAKAEKISERNDSRESQNNTDVSKQ